MCWIFFSRRVKFGKGLPQPAQDAEPLQEVARAADALVAALGRLDAWKDEFAPQAAAIEHPRARAEFFADVELGRTVLPPRSDPDRDWLARALLGFWTGRGGRCGTQENSPAARFLGAILNATLAAAGESPIGPTGLQEIVARWGK